MSEPRLKQSSLFKKKKQSLGGFYVSSLSRNVFILLLVLIGVFGTIVGPVRNNFQERKNLESIKKQLELANADNEHWKQEAARQSDSNFIISYAREHFALIMPSELAMHVADPENAGHEYDLNNYAQKENEILTQQQREFEQYRVPWYERLTKVFADE
ncbi:MAG: hypothetical protein LBQ41_01215 [Candidatus Ancillula sp.]|jgi:cell division protein FtsL|nr:hypothetical protein [Candidatus Ancillula sp.]